MTVEIAKSVKYGYLKFWKSVAINYQSLIQKNEDRLRMYYNLPARVLIKIRPLSSNYGTASMYEFKDTFYYKVELNVRQSEKEFKDTVLHELTHVEQYFEKRMVPGKLFNKIEWEGNLIDVKDSVKQFEEYKLLPWEAEANLKAEALKNKIFLN